MQFKIIEESRSFLLVLTIVFILSIFFSLPAYAPTSLRLGALLKTPTPVVKDDLFVYTILVWSSPNSTVEITPFRFPESWDIRIVPSSFKMNRPDELILYSNSYIKAKRVKLYIKSSPYENNSLHSGLKIISYPETLSPNSTNVAMRQQILLPINLAPFTNFDTYPSKEEIKHTNNLGAKFSTMEEISSSNSSASNAKRENKAPILYKILFYAIFISAVLFISWKVYNYE